MNAVVLTKTCKAEELSVSEVPTPKVKAGWVLIKVRAFGINHSEVLLRQFEADAPYIHLPIIPGIECVGEIADPSDTNFREGEKVFAFMGGMGRSFDGSYAEYVLMPAHHVFRVQSDLAWEELAAIPETYYTAYGSLFTCLRLQSDDVLLVRGASSNLGRAAIQLAHACGARVIASVRNEQSSEALRRIGADDIVLEGDDFAHQVLRLAPEGVNKVLEIIGPTTLRSSLHLLASGGIVCHTGVLGGKYVLDGFDPIKEIPNGRYLTGFYSNSPTQTEIDGMMSLIATGNVYPVIDSVLPLSQISLAHQKAEQRGAKGKIVIKV